MRVESQQLGTLEIPEDAAIRFPQGILGFPKDRTFCLLEVKPGSRFQLLQSTEDSNLAFVVIDPLTVDPGYPLAAVRELAAQAGLAPDEQIGVAAIVTVAPPPARPTVNLMAPLALGLRTRQGLQVVLHAGQYQVRHAL
jgi:flagellar assembly factor FliW